MLVSVIIPTYKGTTNLKRAIDSVLNQSYRNIEVIVVDDNNPDTIDRINTSNIMESYNLDNVFYIKHEYNKNGSAARNSGFMVSKGDFIALLDDDDYFSKSKIEDQVSFFVNNLKYEAVYCWYTMKNNIVKPKLTGSLAKEVLLLKTRIVTPSLMIRRETFKELNGFDETYERHQDYEFLIRFFEKYQIGLVKKNLLTIGNNGGINQKKEEDLDALKAYFFKKFQSKIKSLSKTDKSFNKKIFLIHYTPVFWSHMKSKRLDLSLRVYRLYLEKNKIGFLLTSFSIIKKQINYQINKKLNAIN